MMGEHEPSVVVDLGSSVWRAGFSTDGQPQRISCVIGTPKHMKIGIFPQPSQYVGQKTDMIPGLLKLEYPMIPKEGITMRNINIQSDLEQLWSHTLEDVLKLGTGEHGMLLTESVFPVRRTSETHVEIVFEKHGVPWLNVRPRPLMALMAAGRSTGVVLHSGHSKTTIVPIYDGCLLRHTVSSFVVGGKKLTDVFVDLLQKGGLDLTSTSGEREIARRMKEETCYVALDYDREVQTPESAQTLTTYSLPDGSVTEVGQERFRCPESLFKPTAAGYESGGIDEQLFSLIRKCPIDLRPTLSQNVVLSGGSTMFPGFPERLTKEMGLRSEEKSIPNYFRVSAPVERNTSTWRGAAMFASTDACHEGSVSRREYEELGTCRTYEKFCF